MAYLMFSTKKKNKLIVVEKRKYKEPADSLNTITIVSIKVTSFVGNIVNQKPFTKTTSMYSI